MDGQNLIYRAEKLLKTDVRYISKNGFWVVLNQSITAVSGLLLAVAFANWLPMHEYGVYKFILAAAGLIGTLKLTGFSQAVIQAVARGYDSTVLTAMRQSLLWSAGVVVVAGIVGIYYYLNNNPTLAFGIFLAATTNLVIGALGLYGGYLIGKEHFKTLTLFGIVTTICNTIATGTAIYLTDNVLLIVLSNVLSSLVLIAIFSFITLFKIDKKTSVSRESLSFGKHLSAQNLLMAAGQHIDKILVFQFIGSVQLAQYAFAIMLPDQIYGMLKNVLGIVVPRFSKKSVVEIRRSIKTKVWLLTSLTTVLSFIYIVLAPTLFELLFPKYVDAVIYSQIFALSITFIPANYFVGIYFHILERTRILYRAKILNSIAKISLLVIGALFFGVMGVVVAQLLARVANLAIYGYYYLTERPAQMPQ